MLALSPRLVCLARFASGALLLCAAGPAAAQIPAYPAPPQAGAEVAPAAAGAPEPTPAAVAVEAPSAPAAETRGPSLSAPPAAKSVVISEQHGSREPRRSAEVEPVVVEPRTRPRWYGWQTLVVDGATLSVFVTAAVAGSGDEKLGAKLAVLGLASYELGPGIVHFVHGNPGRGFASFGIRFGLPLTGAFIGASAASGCDGFLCEAGGAAVGALLGVGGAIAIDAALFAYEDPKSRPASRVWLRPLFSFTPQRALIGLAGQL
jgi:hypothetical protein